MISGITLISSVPAGSEEYLAMLRSVSKAIGVDDLSVSPQIFDGVSSVWIHRMDSYEICYEEPELQNIENLLGGAPKTFIMIEFDGGETSVPIMLKLVGGIACYWPIAFDNGDDKIYGPNEIAKVVESGIY